MIETLIVDDEVPARHRLGTLLKSDPEIHVIRECADGASARSAILECKPDLVFLDIEMPELNGLGAIAGIDSRPHIIFVTAHSQYALDAFALHADDYLLKPYKNERLFEAVAYAKEQIRAKALISERQENVASPQESGALAKGLLPIKTDGRLVLLRMQEIEWIEAERDYIRIAAHKTNYLVRETMQGIHSKLDATRFLRIHRSTIVNLLFVRELEPLASGECFVTLRDGRQFTMSRGHRAVLGPLLGIS